MKLKNRREKINPFCLRTRAPSCQNSLFTKFMSSVCASLLYTLFMLNHGIRTAHIFQIIFYFIFMFLFYVCTRGVGGGGSEGERRVFILVPTSLEYPVAMQCYKSWPGPGTFQFRSFCFGYNCSAASLPICFIVVTKSDFSEGRMRFDEREINKFNSGHVNQKLLMGKRGRWLGWWP